MTFPGKAVQKQGGPRPPDGLTLGAEMGPGTLRTPQGTAWGLDSPGVTGTEHPRQGRVMTSSHSICRRSWGAAGPPAPASGRAA